MAYNLLAIAQSRFNWPAVNELYQNTDQVFEMFPIPDSENGDALGISIPTNYLNEQSWNSASIFLTALADLYPLEVYDMYAGHAVDLATHVPDGLDAG